MALFQISVLNKYLQLQKKGVLQKAYKKYTKYFHNISVQENIRNSKEEEYQGIFLIELFVNILGYTLKPRPNFNLVAEYKNQNNARKADGAILKEEIAIGVVELKSTNTKDLENIRRQAFDYKANQKGCVYVITSNFEKLRFYINDATEFEEFNLFTLTQKQFNLLYLCLHKNCVFENLPLKIKEESLTEEDKITKSFYADYSLFKRELYRDLVKQNAKRLKNDLRNELKEVAIDSVVEDELQKLEKNAKQALFKKSQKLIDRFLFIFFAEDRGLLPPNSTVQILNKWRDDNDFGDERPLYNLFKQYFRFLDTGRRGTIKRAEIFAYNGGLFKPDTVLDEVSIDDELLHKHTLKLANYDFQSQVDVNILGHIFENSLNEIESVNAEIEGGEFDKQKSKRKKDGVFYTPKYITKYIVENTVGKLCSEKKKELGIKEEEYFKSRKNRPKRKLLELVKAVDNYRDWLLKITICDPACGSGAFLNQALDFLIKEHHYLDELKAQLLGGAIVFSDIEKTILENNIYGVDLNEESVEIAKLSLWLRTAQPRRRLNDLSNNIKCGNSLIDSKLVAGDKAFNWREEFPTIFKEKNLKAFHITTAIHDSRTSERMERYKVREKREQGTNPYPNIVYFTKEDDLIITKTIADIVEREKLYVLAYNICADHIHLLLVCEEGEISGIMQMIKGTTARVYNQSKGISGKGDHKGFKPLGNSKTKPLWSQKYGFKEITTEEQLQNTIYYINKNRSKHELPQHSREISDFIVAMCCSIDRAFQTEKGGFDVVIGNPPYVSHDRVENKKFLSSKYKSHQGFADLFCYFYELGVNSLRLNGILSFITSNSFLKAEYGTPLRKFLKKTSTIIEIINVEDAQIFSDAIVNSSILTLQKGVNKEINALIVNKKYDLYIDFRSYVERNKFYYCQNDFDKLPWNLISPQILKLRNKIKKSNPTLEELNAKIRLGLATGSNEAFIVSEDIKNNLIAKDSKSKDLIKPMLRGKDIQRYYYELPNLYLLLTKNGIDIVNNYPAVYEHLNSFGDKFKNRGAKGQHWTNLRACSFFEDFKKDKIVWIELTDVGRFSRCLDEIYLLNSAYFLLPPKGMSIGYLLILLNSRLIKFYLKQIANTSGVGTTRWINIYVKEFPIYFANKFDQRKCENLEVNISSLLKKLNTILKNFTYYLESKFQFEKLPRKLQNWHNLDFGEFIKELNKAIKKVGGEKLSKMDEMEWMEVFETKKVIAQSLKAEIDQTDKEIDQMVYELYGLTDDEIKIVENS